MTSPMKPFFTRDSALHFMRETLVGSMEGTLFVLLSVLFTVAGAAALLEDFAPALGTGEMTANVTPAPATTTAAHALQQIATMNDAFAGSRSSAPSR